jgi:hypothetical protein
LQGGCQQANLLALEAFWRALSVEPIDALFLQGVGQVLVQSLNLAGGLGGHNYKVVGKGGQPAQIQHHNVFGQFFRGHFNN